MHGSRNAIILAMRSSSRPASIRIPVVLEEGHDEAGFRLAELASHFGTKQSKGQALPYRNGIQLCARELKHVVIIVKWLHLQCSLAHFQAGTSLSPQLSQETWEWLSGGFADASAWR